MSHFVENVKMHFCLYLSLPYSQENNFRKLTFVDHLCYLCLVFVILSRLFIAALWSSEGKG